MAATTTDKNKKRKRSPSDSTAPDSKRPRAPEPRNERFSRIGSNTKIDPRIGSNAYIPYGYAERAHRDLSVTKGNRFTKEKNKKKRGSYRGGPIDTEAVNSFKFDD
jgi:hypothetical protein